MWNRLTGPSTCALVEASGGNGTFKLTVFEVLVPGLRLLDAHRMRIQTVRRYSFGPRLGRIVTC